MTKEEFRASVEALLDSLNTDINALLDEEQETIEGDASFPIVWNIGDEPDDGEGGAPVDNPLIMRVHSAAEFDEPNARYEINLSDAVDTLLWHLDDEAAPMIEKVRDALVVLAERTTEKLDEHYSD
jgi:hypothetical protein